LKFAAIFANLNLISPEHLNNKFLKLIDFLKFFFLNIEKKATFLRDSCRQKKPVKARRKRAKKGAKSMLKGHESGVKEGNFFCFFF
jgi:hypothetical protein